MHDLATTNRDGADLAVNDPAKLAQAARIIRAVRERKAQRELTRSDVELAA